MTYYEVSNQELPKNSTSFAKLSYAEAHARNFVLHNPFATLIIEKVSHELCKTIKSHPVPEKSL